MRVLAWTDTAQLRTFLLTTEVHCRLPILDLHDIMTDPRHGQDLETEKRREIIQRLS